MLKIFNHEFFGFDVVECDEYDNEKNMLSINITVDPQEFDLKSYKRSPFSSILLDNNAKYLDHVDKDGWRDLAIQLIDNNFQNDTFYQYNLYCDDEYESLTHLFSNRRFHTMLYYQSSYHMLNKSSYPHMIMVGAFPVKGIISPIQKSNHYKLYNGCFINCKPFQWEHEYYNKLVYVLVDIYSHFSFQEFVKTDNDEYGILIDHKFYIEYDSIVYQQNVTHIPYNGRDELFAKPSKNIFYLSDVPKDIMMNRDTMSVKV